MLIIAIVGFAVLALLALCLLSSLREIAILRGEVHALSQLITTRPCQPSSARPFPTRFAQHSCTPTMRQRTRPISA